MKIRARRGPVAIFLALRGALVLVPPVLLKFLTLLIFPILLILPILPILLTLLIPQVARAAEPPTGLTLTGRVLLADDQPAVGASAVLLPLEGPVERAVRLAEGEDEPPSLATTVTDAAGLFHLTSPGGPGMFRVLVRHPGHTPMQFTLVPLLQSVDLPSVTLPAARTVTVRVVTPTDRAAAGALVLVRPAERGCRNWCPAERFGRTDGRGRWQALLGYDEPGGVRAWAPGWGESELLSTDGDSLEIPLQAAVERIVRILEASDRPVAGAAVLVGEERWPAGITDDQGAVTLNLPPRGEATVWVDDGQGRRERHVLAPSEPPLLHLRSRRMLIGTVRDATTGTPLPDAIVWPEGWPDLAIRATPRAVRSAPDSSAPDSSAPDRPAPDQAGSYRLPLPQITASLRIVAASPDFLTRAVPLFGEGPEAEGRLDLPLEPAATLEGRVVNPQGGTIAGAEVQAFPFGIGRQRGQSRRSAGSLAKATARTDARGRFLLRSLTPEEPLVLRAEAPGFLSEMQLGAAPEMPDLVLTLEPARWAAGQVVDRDYQPVAGAEVRVVSATEATSPSRAFSGGQQAGGRTEADGAFRLGPLRPGVYDLSVFRRGFEHTLVRGVEVGSAPQTELGTVVLEPGATLEGVVLDRQDRPLAGVQIEPSSPAWPLRQRANPGARDVVTDAEGRFRLSELRWGERLDLSFRLPGFLDQRLPQVEVPQEEPLEVRLSPAARLVGEVRGRGRQPVQGAIVRLTAAQREGFAAGDEWGDATDAAGAFAIEGITPGRLRMLVTAEGHAPLSRALEIVAGEPQNLRLQMEEGAVIEGRLVTAAGTPLPGGQVKLVDFEALPEDAPPWDYRIAASVDADGWYRLAGVPGGKVTLQASAPGYPPVEAAVTAEGSGQRLDFTFPAGVALSGTVVDQNLVPLPLVLVQLRPRGAGGAILNATTSSRGRFSFVGVPDGTYLLSAQDLRGIGGRAEQSIEVAGQALSNLRLEIARSPEAEPGRIVGRILGLAFDEIAEVELVAVNEAVAQIEMGVLDFEGNFQIEDLPPGTWLVTAVLVGRGREVQRSATVEAGEEARLDLTFGDGLRLTGRLLRQGEPAAGMTVKIIATDLPDGRVVTSDHGGRFAAADLPAGSYRLAVLDPHRRLVAQQAVDLSTDLDLEIALGGGTLTVSARDAVTEAPLAGVRLSLRARDPLLAGGSNAFAATTGADGRAAFSNLPAGGWNLRAEAEGHVSQTREIELSPLDAAEIALALAPAEGLSLEVRRPEGSPVSRVLVSVLTAAGPPLVSGRFSANAEGRVEIPGVGPGRWSLVVGDGSLVAYPVVAVPGPAVPVILQPSGQVQLHIPDLIENPGRARARLIAPDGRPLPLLSTSGDALEDRPVHNGQITLYNVPEGSWGVRVEAADGRRWQSQVQARAGSLVEIRLD